MRKILVSLVLGFVGLFAFASSVFASAVIYNNVDPIPGNVPSVGYEATSTSEFGGQIQFSGSERANPTVTILMSSWACQSGAWEHGDCSTTPGATFEHPITLNVYNVNEDNSVGTEIISVTQTFTMPYRPSVDDVSCTGGDAGKWYSTADSKCYNGYAFPISFNLAGTTLPGRVIIGVEYNTSHYGAIPLGTTGPYDSLNVGTEPTPSVGTALPTVNDAYLNSSWSGAYCAGNQTTGTFRLDAGCWGGYLPAFKVEAETPPVSICHLEKKSSTNYHLIIVDADAVAAHLKHGDKEPGEGITNDCSSVLLTGEWTLSVNNGAYVHNMFIDSVASDGTITGHGGYPSSGPPYPYPYNWTLTGQLTGNEISLTLDYQNSYTATITGTVNNALDSMSGGAGSGGVANWSATR